MNNSYSYLALGDSYTIGEGVPLYESFPYQAVQLLRKQEKYVHAAEIVARTGWTTADLNTFLNSTILNPRYDFVSLLIGVNNQYRGVPVDQYALEFVELLKKAIARSGNRQNRVFVLSIPDWSLTPYGRTRDFALAGREIAQYNLVNRRICDDHGVHYIDVTTGSPETAGDISFLSPDALHPSGKAYQRWANLLYMKIINEL